MDSSATPMSPTDARRRVVSREHETPSQRIKREKAAERQRRKRERDRMGQMPYHHPPPPPQAPPPPQQISPTPAPPLVVHVQAPQMVQPPPEQQHHLSNTGPSDGPTPGPSYEPPPPPGFDPNNPPPGFGQMPPTFDASQYAPPQYPAPPISADDEVRRERVRAAARERQRKHRALVKSRKQAEAQNRPDRPAPTPEFDAGPNDASFRGFRAPHPLIPPPPDLPADSPQYHQVMAELSGPNGADVPMHEGMPDVQQPSGGQTFATTLLLALTCSSMLKAHLLRTLNITDDDLRTLEPIMADAWERWNAARHGVTLPPPPPGHFEVQAQTTTTGQPANTGFPPPPNPNDSNDFRARFHRPLVAPSPFQAPPQHAPPQGDPDEGEDEIDPALKSE